MNILISFFLLISGVSASDKCNCFSLALVKPPYISGDAMCYQYRIRRELAYDECPGNIDYYVLSSDAAFVSGLFDLITYSSNDEYIVAPYYGDRDGTGVNGIKIHQQLYDSDIFTICFNASRVVGTKENGLVGFKDSNGDSYSCSVGSGVLPHINPYNVPPIARDDSASVTIAASTNIMVLSNDYDPDDDKFWISSVGSPNIGGEAIKNGNNIRYTPRSSKCGAIAPTATYKDTFTYTITDSNGESDKATVTVTVQCIQSKPTDDALKVIAMTDEDSTIDIPVLGGDTLSIYRITRQPNDGGSAVINGNIITYYPGNTCDDIAGTSYDADYVTTFEYATTDEGYISNATTVTVTVTVVCNRATPTAKSNTVSTNEDKHVSIPLIDGTEDPEGNPVTIIGITTPQYGTITPPAPDDTIIYTPDPTRCFDIIPNKQYTDSFIFTIQDSDDYTRDNATIYVTVYCIREKPMAFPDSKVTTKGESVVIDALNNDFDLDGIFSDDIEIYDIVTPPQFGNVVFNIDQITYNPDTNACNSYFMGEISYVDTFEYNIIDYDDNLVSEPATVIVTIKCERQPPISVDSYFKSDENTAISTSALDGYSDADDGSIGIVSNTGPAQPNTDILYDAKLDIRSYTKPVSSSGERGDSSSSNKEEKIGSSSSSNEGRASEGVDLLNENTNHPEHRRVLFEAYRYRWYDDDDDDDDYNDYDDDAFDEVLDEWLNSLTEQEVDYYYYSLITPDQIQTPPACEKIVYSDDIRSDQTLMKKWAKCSVDFAKKVITGCSDQFKLILKKIKTNRENREKETCALFEMHMNEENKWIIEQAKPLKCAGSGNVAIKAFKPSGGWTNWGCGVSKSSNAPMPITIAEISTDGQVINNHYYPYFLKKMNQRNGAVGDYTAMKVAKWFNSVFTTLYQKKAGRNAKQPIIKVFDIVPEFQPQEVSAEAKKMYFFSGFDVNYQGNWMKSNWDDDNPPAQVIAWFNGFKPTDCRCNPQLLESLRGAFIMQMLLGVTDRHSRNIGISNPCTVMNIDYGYFLGINTPSMEQKMKEKNWKVVSMWNKFISAYLKSATADKTYLSKLKEGSKKLHGPAGTKDTCSLKDVFFAELWNDIQDLRDHFGNTAYTQTNKKFTEFFGAPYFSGNEKAAVWLDLVPNKNRGSNEHPLNAVEYISFMLFGKPKNEKLNKKRPSIATEFKAFRKQMIADMPANNWYTGGKSDKVVQVDRTKHAQTTCSSI